MPFPTEPAPICYKVFTPEPTTSTVPPPTTASQVPCSCTNGFVSRTAVCSEEVDEKCWFCNAGYELNEGPEVFNSVTGKIDQIKYCTALPTTTPEPTTTTFAVDCFCENGIAGEAGRCTPGNQLICDSCDDGYVLMNLGLSSVCERRTTTTSTTTV